MGVPLVARPFSYLQAGFESWRAATLSPLQFKSFRALWLASIGAYFGTVVQTVGASWHMTTLGVTAEWVAYVQTASLAPIVVLALPAGALADTSDRRTLMLWAQVLGVIAALALVAVALLGLVTPFLLLLFTVLLGCASALYQPAWQASVSDLIDRPRLPAAIALNALAYNAARSLGPALGGVIVAAGGAAAAFAFNAVSFLGLTGVVAFWRAPKTADTLPPEPIGRAVMSGIRYAMLSRTLTAIFARGALFGLCASSVLALMPLIAKDRLGGGPLTYGLLLGGFGVGSMAAALLTANVRQAMSAQRLVDVSTIAFGVATIMLAMSPSTTIIVLLLMIAGAAWIWVLATIGACVQMSCPRWVVGRGVAMGQISSLGGLAAGSAIWGVAATHLGLQPAILASGVALLATLLLARLMPLPDTEGFDFTLSDLYKVPAPGAPLDPRSGPIVVTIEYRIPLSQSAEFLTAVHELGRVRQRDGARRWSVSQDLDDPELWHERYQSPTWTEHLRRVSRLTVADQAIRERVLGLHQGDPTVRRLLERPAGADPIGEARRED